MGKKADKGYRFTKIGPYYSSCISVTQSFKGGRGNYICDGYKFKSVGRGADAASLRKKTFFKV